MRALRRKPLVAVLGGLAVAAPVSAALPAYAAPNPGQAVENDYGQTEAEVTAEVNAAVSADAGVKAARAKVATAHALVISRAAAQTKAAKVYKKALRTHKKKTIAKAKRAYKLARSRTASARAAETAAAKAAASVVAQKTAAVRWMHYRPVDGVWQGARSSYYIPDDGKLHPIEVRITVSGGHVTAVSVPVSETSGETGRINEAALPVLIERALAAGDTAEVASVSGASLTSYAFRNSLSSALLRAGYHA